MVDVPNPVLWPDWLLVPQPLWLLVPDWPAIPGLWLLMPDGLDCIPVELPLMPERVPVAPLVPERPELEVPVIEEPAGWAVLLLSLPRLDCVAEVPLLSPVEPLDWPPSDDPAGCAVCDWDCEDVPRPDCDDCEDIPDCDDIPDWLDIPLWLDMPVDGLPESDEPLGRAFQFVSRDDDDDDEPLMPGEVLCCCELVPPVPKRRSDEDDELLLLPEIPELELPEMLEPLGWALMSVWPDIVPDCL